MPIYTLAQRLKNAKNSYDFTSLAYSYAHNENMEEAAKLCNRAMEVAKHFGDYLETAWSMHQYGWPDASPIFGNIYQECLVQAEKGLEEILNPEWPHNGDFLDQFDFLFLARHFHSMGREDAAFKAFSIAYRVEQDNTLFDYIEMAHSIRSLNWFENVAGIQLLIDELVKSIGACLELPTQELLDFEGESAFDYYDFADAGKRALEIGWMQTGSSCFKRSIEAVEQLDETAEIRRQKLLDVISYFANSPELHDWALEHYEPMLEKATTSAEVVLLASYLTMFENADTEAYICKRLLEKDASVFDQNELLLPVCLSLQDSELQYHLIAKAIAQAESAETLFKVIKHLHGKTNYTDLFEQAIGLLDQQPDYLNALFEEYAVEHNLPPEEFMKRLELHVERYGLDTEVGEELLVRGCYLGRNEVVRKLLEWGVPATCSDKNGCNTLLASLLDLNVKFAGGGDPIEQDLIALFIASGASFEPTMYQRRVTSVLHEAACDGYLSVVKALLDRGASYELKGDEGKEVLLRAAYTSRIDVLQYLLEQGCDANSISEKPSFWHYNSFDDEQKTLELLKAHGAQFS